MDQPKYGFRVAWSEEDESWVATCPDFPMLSAFGESVQEAVDEAGEVLARYIEEYERDGVVLPEASVVREYSGQIRLRMPKKLHQRTALTAAEQEVSLNRLLVDLIHDGLEARVRREDSQMISDLCVKIESLVTGDLPGRSEPPT